MKFNPNTNGRSAARWLDAGGSIQFVRAHTVSAAVCWLLHTSVHTMQSITAFSRAVGPAAISRQSGSRARGQQVSPCSARFQQLDCRQQAQLCRASHAESPGSSSTAGAAALAALMLHASLAAGAFASQLEQQASSNMQQVDVCRLAPQPQADIAGLFDSPNDIDPFTLYGTNFKKYQIEQMQGEKVISRQRGFTVDSCVSAIAASQEDPEFNGLSLGEKVQNGEGLLCKRATGQDLKVACKQSCTTACTEALATYEERLFAETGYKLEPKERDRVLKNCRHSCSYECTKSGKSHDFVVPYRR